MGVKNQTALRAPARRASRRRHTPGSAGIVGFARLGGADRLEPLDGPAGLFAGKVWAKGVGRTYRSSGGPRVEYRDLPFSRQWTDSRLRRASSARRYSTGRAAGR